MNISDFAVPLIGFGVAINSAIETLKKGFKTKDVVDIILGLFIMGFSLSIASDNSDTIIGIRTDNNNLQKGVTMLLSQRALDSINNYSFQKYLRDSFGIEKKGDKPVIYNTKIYLSKSTQDSVRLRNIVVGSKLFKALPNQTVFLTPGSPSDIEKYTVVLNGAFMTPRFYSVQKGKVTFMQGVLKDDEIFVKWIY